MEQTKKLGEDAGRRYNDAAEAFAQTDVEQTGEPTQLLLAGPGSGRNKTSRVRTAVRVVLAVSALALLYTFTSRMRA